MLTLQKNFIVFFNISFFSEYQLLMKILKIIKEAFYILEIRSPIF
jgi:hypothetical protein